MFGRRGIAFARSHPDEYAPSCFITVIAGFVTLVMMIVEAYLPELNAALGIYLPLIVVKCIVLGRAEVFASKHPCAKLRSTASEWA